ncbi:MAG: HEAT repeat domain-containing protein [Planctomycetota bacterium]
MLIDDHKELVEISHRFVCMKFCEADDKGEYYRAAGYFLPQWYWQPILGIAYPDGREINIHWQNTHVVTPVNRLIGIMKEALAITGDGLDPVLVKKNRALLGDAEDALSAEKHEAALEIALRVKAAVSRGWVRSDAEKIEREALFLKKVKKEFEQFNLTENPSKEEEDLCTLFTYCLARQYPEAFTLSSQLAEKGEKTREIAAGLREELKGLLKDTLEISRVALGRFRVGPEIFHHVRSQVRNRIGSIEEILLQYHVLLDDGTVYSAYQGHGWLDKADHHRGSVFLPYREVATPDRIADIRLELWLGTHRIDQRHLKPDPSTEPWWEGEKPRALIPDFLEYGNWWNSTEFPKSDKTGTRVGSGVKGLKKEFPPDPVLDEIKEIYAVLDGRRFSGQAVQARYQLLALGSKALPTLVPLAYRWGAVTTYQLLFVLGRSPHASAAGAVIHNIGADDVTLKSPAFGLIPWLEGQPYVPLEECIDYLGSDSRWMRERAASALGKIGKKEAFLPLLDFLRTRTPGSSEAEVAVNALMRLTGLDFGLDPEKPLTEQKKAVESIHGWWRNGADKSSRTVWMAQALESMGFAPKGTLGKAVQGEVSEKVLAALRKALADDRTLPQRSALLLVKDLRIQSLGPLVLKQLLSMGSSHINYGLARNTVRDLMTKELLAEFIGLLTDRSKVRMALDFLLVVTGEHALYAGRRQMGQGDLASLQGRWKSWLEKNKDSLRWNAEEKMFILDK